MREAGLCHICIALVSNLAAGIAAAPISNENVFEIRHRHQERLQVVVRNVISLIYQQQHADCHCGAAAGVPQLPTWDAVVPAAS